MNTRGFTLIETLVYLALFALIIGGFVSAAYMMFETNDRNQTLAMMHEEEDFLLAKITWALRAAENISDPSDPAPATRTSGSTLTLSLYDGTSATISRSGSDIIYNFVPLNNSNVTISKLVFVRRHESGTNIESIETGFTVSARASNGSIITEIASTTHYVRI